MSREASREKKINWGRVGPLDILREFGKTIQELVSKSVTNKKEKKIEKEKDEEKSEHKSSEDASLR
ncbi:conserved hypothetical protein [Ricinus communis]|uniref:Uncharacterized protein n=1 Tax=Ricinus communis TaxID=3988 RepID=B9RL35_RICCO|nr:conserved hypothetical protein [Ricinus communis]